MDVSAAVEAGVGEDVCFGFGDGEGGSELRVLDVARMRLLHYALPRS